MGYYIVIPNIILVFIKAYSVSGGFLGRLRLALFDFREIGNGANALTKPLLAPIFFKAGISD